MSKNKDIYLASDVEEQEATRTVVLSEETYLKLLEVTEAADARGLNSSLEYYLASFVKQGAKVRLDLWNKSDGTSQLLSAQKGNVTAQLAVLTSLYGKDVATRMMEATKKEV